MKKGKCRASRKRKTIPLILLCLFLLAAACLGGLNLLVDPFGVFGDPVMHWQAYDMTQNPQTAKFAYLKKHPDKYDAFLIGGSETGAYSVDVLNEYTGRHFYNFSMSRGDGQALETMATYLAEEKHPKELILCLAPNQIWGRQYKGNPGSREGQASRVDQGNQESQKSQESQTSSKDIDYGDLSLCLPNTEEDSATLFSNSRYLLRYLFLNPKYSVKKLADWKKHSYFPSNFDLYVPETGCLDSRIWDVAHIGDLKSYQLTDPQLWKSGSAPSSQTSTGSTPSSQTSTGSAPSSQTSTGSAPNSQTSAGSAPSSQTSADPAMLDPQKPKELAQRVARIKSLCLKKGIQLQVVLSPTYQGQPSSWNQEVLKAGFRDLAQVTDFWDFSGVTDHSGVCLDSRYFYDASHFRKAVGNMILARMFHDSSGYAPPGFGVPITANTVESRLADAWKPSVTGISTGDGSSSSADRAMGRLSNRKGIPSLDKYSVQVPILMFHNLGYETKNGVTESPEHFLNQIQALSEAGYHTLFFSDLVNYVDIGKDLPSKPLLITLDDGYLSNYTMAWKILKQYGMKATIFSIGSRVGTTTYNHFGKPLSSYFNYEQAKQMWKSGVCDIQSHTYNMHQESYFDGKGCRRGVLPLPGEDEAHYIQAFKQDIERSRSQLEENVGTRIMAFAYPYGFFTSFSEALLKEEGIRATVTVNPGINSIVKGLPESLQSLCRISVNGKMSGKKLVTYLEYLTNRATQSSGKYESGRFSVE